jgi:hypothetical protein
MFGMRSYRRPHRLLLPGVWPGHAGSG